MIDRDLAELLAREDQPAQHGSFDERVDALPRFDDGPAADPFAQLPKGLG